MADKVKIDKINIKIGDQEIPLTLDQAKELQALLNDTFGKKFTPSYPIYIECPVYRRPYRYPYDPNPYPYDPNPYFWSVTCGDTDSSVTFSLNA